MRLGLPAEVTFHGDVRRWGRLPFEDAVCVGTLDGKGGQGVIFEQRLKNLSIGLEAISLRPTEIGCCSGLGVCGIEAQVGVNEEGSIEEQHNTSRELGPEGYRPRAGIVGPAGCQGMRQGIELGKDANVLGVMLSGKPKLLVGVKAHQGG